MRVGVGQHSATVDCEARAAIEVVPRGVGVQVEQVVHRYGRFTALGGLNLTVSPGEALGLLGPNGAGKTTLMHILAGVVRPSGGRVQVGDLGPPHRRRVRRAIGLAPQALSVYPRLTAAENLRFFARLQGVPRAAVAQRVEEGLRLSNLHKRRDDRAGNFSGGMQRRLNLACALVHHPQLLLLDEPTAGVDPQSRGALFEAIAALKATGLTVICSTHLIDEAERLCDRIAIIDDGQVAALESTSSLVARYGGTDLHSAFLQLTGKELRDQ